jgi:hypothetical protein
MKIWNEEHLKNSNICMISDHFDNNNITDLNHLELLLQLMHLLLLILQCPPMEARQSPLISILTQEWIQDTVSIPPKQEHLPISRIRSWTTE